MYQYDPETKEFKLRRSRRPWMEEGTSSDVSRETDMVERTVTLPEALPTEPEAPLPGADVDAGDVLAQPVEQRGKRRRRGPSPYLPQESDSHSQNLMSRLIWVLIFLMVVAWVLMMSPLINRIQSNELPLFRQDLDQTPFPKL